MTSFVRQYIETALWSSITDDDTPMDRNYSAGDLTPEAVASVTKDCDDFLAAASGETPGYPDLLTVWYTAGRDETDVAHDFWLTRNGHGAGFWDRFGRGHVAYETGNKLSELAKSYGSSDLYVTDDGKVGVA